jgi:hypothetical protein
MLIKTNYIGDYGKNKIIKLDNRTYLPLCKICLDADIHKLQNFIESIEKANVSAGSFNNTDLYIAENIIWIKKSDWKKKILLNTKTANQKKRELNLMQKIRDMKLEYESCRISEGYIKYGNPDLNVVLDYFVKTQDEKNQRMFDLIRYLDNSDMCYDPNIPAYCNYINHGGNLKKVIKDAHVECFLVNETNYLLLLKKYDADDAKEMALMKYVQDGGSHEIAQKYIREKTTIRFE